MDNNNTSLTSSEESRLDDLLTASRNFHYSSIFLSAVLLTISISNRNSEKITIPILNVESEPLIACLVSFFIVIILTILADNFFTTAYPYITLDKRRPPFAWVAISEQVSYLQVTLWLLLPPIICSISIFFLIKSDPIGITLAIISPFLVLPFRLFKQYWYYIKNRLDERGGKATLSIYILYWYRIIRNFVVMIYLLAPIFAISEKIRSNFDSIKIITIYIFGCLFIIRMIGGIRFIYKLIDRLGKRYNFPIQSDHYE